MGVFIKPAPVPVTIRGSRSEQAHAKTRESLLSLLAELTERELFLANLSGELSAFEGEYIRQIGMLYAKLDELTIRICFHVPTAEDTEEAQSVAVVPRAWAGEFSAAVHGENPASQDFVSMVERKTMYREVAARRHRDLATDADDHLKCELPKAESEAANQSSNTDPRKRTLDEYRNRRTFVRGNVICSDLAHPNLQMRQVKSRLSQIEMETAVLMDLDVAKLRAKVEVAKTEGRELLDELAQGLGLRIELLRSLSEACSSRKRNTVTAADEWPTALIAREPVTLNSHRSAALVTRGLMDLRTEEEAAEDWKRRGLLIQSDGGHEEADCGSRPGFRSSNDHAPSHVPHGRACLRGLGLPLDYCGAAALFRRAAGQGHAHAANSLGFLYEHGLGVDQDYEQAFAWYFHAAGRGLAIAQFNLDKLYDDGRGIARGYAQAAEHWYRTAAGDCDAADQRNLGLMYAMGKGVPPDDAEAAYWFHRAAQQGDAIAQEQLGLMYALGKGMPKDRAEAIFWCCKAAMQGYRPAHDALKILSRNRRARNARTTRSTSRFPRGLLRKTPATVPFR